MTFYDRMKTVAATANGAGNITWTVAADQHALPPTSISETVIYTVMDSAGDVWETGMATLAESGGTYTITRGGAQTVTAGSSGAATPVSLTNSSAHTLILAPDAHHFNRLGQLLDTEIASASSSIEFELPSEYSRFVIQLLDVAVSVDAQLYAVLSDDDGSSYVTSGYIWVSHQVRDGVDSSGGGTDTEIRITVDEVESTGDGANASIEVFGLDAAYSTNVTIKSMYKRDDSYFLMNNIFCTVPPESNAYNKIKIYPSSGNLASGKIQLYGQ